MYPEDQPKEPAISQNRKSGQRVRARSARSRPHIVVDRVEIVTVHGTLALRFSDTVGLPFSVVFPAEFAVNALGPLRSAILEAEEAYWSLVPSLVRSFGTAEPNVVAERMAAWHREQGWDRVIEFATADGPASVMLLTHAGHVGICADPPYSGEPLLAIFDPLQLRRIEPGLVSALGQALREQGSRHWSQRLRAARRHIDSRQWIIPGDYCDPAPEAAAAHMRERYVEYLRRSPVNPGT
ncbi:hypothetical protein [Nocardia cyriacigeorgica]|uniref:hypothetical protein n=1 Tax=Nocardia cyriacigeorgica TaxID=135487 RepID=UPI0018940415|nr:hypothetical protein [Nocardia cyriacigeorgica]MBF6456135.1 hypothetical protein [Nocardia cyriacigeorgica]MBF6553125.1 hypothetical protein [Nocardia cyriacigeorgica]